MDNDTRRVDGAPIFDDLNVDLFVKVLSNTIFSPSFAFLVPIFYLFQGAKLNDPTVVTSSSYLIAISLFWFIRWYSKLYRNQASLLFGPGPLDWSEQIVVVTGGSSGIGELLVNTLAVRNVTVVVLDVKPIVTENYNVTYYKCDVSNWEEVDAVSKKIIVEIGDPTILINNAGVVQGKLILDLTPKDIQQTFGVNTLGHFWTIKAFLPGMLKRKSGHIVSISSIMGFIGVAQMTDYNSSKAAIVSLHESIRFELDNRYKCPNIRTTLVCPGHVHTDMFMTFGPPSLPITRFLFPSVTPVAVVKRVVAALDEQFSQQIFLPFYTYFVPYLPLLPSFIRNLAQTVTNADYAMKDFVKLSGRRDNEMDEGNHNRSKST